MFHVGTVIWQSYTVKQIYHVCLCSDFLTWRDIGEIWLLRWIWVYLFFQYEATRISMFCLHFLIPGEKSKWVIFFNLPLPPCKTWKKIIDLILTVWFWETNHVITKSDLKENWLIEKADKEILRSDLRSLLVVVSRVIVCDNCLNWIWLKSF